MSEVPEDTEWLPAERLYLARGEAVSPHRPYYQGDVISGVAMPSLPRDPAPAGYSSIEFKMSRCMLLPHPCQCYHGDELRKVLTVAPVEPVSDFANFGENRDRALDRFALPVSVGDSDQNYVANFGKLLSVPRKWILAGQRESCLSHEGLGLLAKRLIRFQLRNTTTLAKGMTFTQQEWAESFLMEAWTATRGSLAGYSAWLQTPMVVPGVNNGEAIAPYNVRAAAQAELVALIYAGADAPIDLAEAGAEQQA